MSKLYDSKTFKKNEKLYDEKRKKNITIGITYLDKNKYGLKFLFKNAVGNKQCIEDFNSFILSARGKSDINEFISEYVSHYHSKSNDDLTREKINELREEYNLEINHLIHLHCKKGGNGEFVIHGFQIDNIFEIIWLDVNHSIHK